MLFAVLYSSVGGGTMKYCRCAKNYCFLKGTCHETFGYLKLNQYFLIFLRGDIVKFFYSMTHFVRNLTPPMPDIIEFLIIEFFALRGESYTAKLDLSQLS